MGLSQSACADCLFLTEDTVKSIEDGDARIGLGAFVTVLWALGLVEAIDGPLAPVEHEERPVFLPALIPEWQRSKLPTIAAKPALPDLHEDDVLPCRPRWPAELWALEDRVMIGDPFTGSGKPDLDAGTQENDLTEAECFQLVRALTAGRSVRQTAERMSETDDRFRCGMGLAGDQKLVIDTLYEATEGARSERPGLGYRVLRSFMKVFQRRSAETASRKVA